MEQVVIMLYSHHIQEVGHIPYYELLFLVLTAASLYDLTRYQVPNALMASALCISLFRLFELQEVSLLFSWLAGIFIPFILCFIFYRCHMIGASDIKLFSVIGSFVGVNRICSIMVTALFFGAAMAIVKMIIRKNFFRRFRRLINYVTECMQEKKVLPYYDRKVEGEDGVIPFTIAISLATLFCVF